MGAKIITEKDFWMCSCGAVPAQMQASRTSNKKSTGEAYITIADTATSSWMDFKCTKGMLLGALIGALVAVVAAVVIVALVVGTGGLGAIALIGIGGMMMTGAVGGVIGGVVMAAVGALKCGQKNATARQWVGSKDDLTFTGSKAVTSTMTMTCKVGGVITFAPGVKSQLDAVFVGGLNYLTKFAECALAGAAVGAGGYLIPSLAAGTLSLAAPTTASVISNVAGSFGGVWGGSRALFGLNNLTQQSAAGKVNSGSDAFGAVVDGGIPEIGMGQRLLSGNPQPSDYLIFLYFLNIKAGKNAPPVEEPANTGDKDGNTPSDKDGNATPEDDGVQSKGQGGDEGGQSGGKNGDAYEGGGKKPSYQQGHSDGGPGTWESRATPTKGAAYQEKVTGAPKNTEYVVKTDKMKSGEKKFDGYDPETNTLKDAKDWTDWPPKGNKGWEKAAKETEIKNARKDADIAKEAGSDLEYHVPTEEKAQELRDIFSEEGIDIDVVVTPK